MGENNGLMIDVRFGKILQKYVTLKSYLGIYSFLRSTTNVAVKGKIKNNQIISTYCCFNFTVVKKKT